MTVNHFLKILVPASYEVEKGQGDAALNQLVHEQQQQDHHQQEENQGAHEVSASGEPSSAIDYDTPTHTTSGRS